ncbi:hypothetical protein [Candidatus Foliamicus sp.]
MCGILRCYRTYKAPVYGKHRNAAFNTVQGRAIDAQTIRCGCSGESMEYNTANDYPCSKGVFS